MVTDISKYQGGLVGGATFLLQRPFLIVYFYSSCGVRSLGRWCGSVPALIFFILLSLAGFASAQNQNPFQDENTLSGGETVSENGDTRSLPPPLDVELPVENPPVVIEPPAGSTPMVSVRGDENDLPVVPGISALVLSASNAAPLSITGGLTLLLPSHLGYAEWVPELAGGETIVIDISIDVLLSAINWGESVGLRVRFSRPLPAGLAIQLDVAHEARPNLNRFVATFAAGSTSAEWTATPELPGRWHFSLLAQVFGGLAPLEMSSTPSFVVIPRVPRIDLPPTGLVGQELRGRVYLDGRRFQHSEEELSAEAVALPVPEEVTLTIAVADHEENRLEDFAVRVPAGARVSEEFVLSLPRAGLWTVGVLRGTTVLTASFNFGVVSGDNSIIRRVAIGEGEPPPPLLTLSAPSSVPAGTGVEISLLAERAPAAEVTVEVTGRRGGDDAAEVRQVILDSSVSSATAAFGVLESGEWTFSATAGPAGLLNTSSATVTVMVKRPPPLLILSAPSSVPAGAGVEIALLAEHAPAGDVTVEVTGRRSDDDAAEVRRVTLDSSVFWATAVFGVLELGEWTFSARAEPAGLLNTSSATVTVMVEQQEQALPILSLTAAAEHSGELTYSTQLSSPPWPVSGHHPRVAPSPKNRLVFVAPRDRNLRVFRMSADGSVPTQLRSYPIGGIRSWAHDMVVSPDGQLLFVAGCLSRSYSDFAYSISVWRIGADGSLAQLSNYRVARGMDIALSPDGRLLFAKDAPGNRLHVWPVDKAQGALGEGSSYIQHVGDEITISPDGRLLFVSGNGDGISMWQINADDATLKEVTNYYGEAGELSKARIAVGLDSRTLFAASEYGHLSVIRITGANSLRLLSVRRGAGWYRPVKRCTDYWGRPKYAPGVCTPNGLSQARAVALSPDGSHLYVAGKEGASYRYSLSTWEIDMAAGRLSRARTYLSAQTGGAEELVIGAGSNLLFVSGESGYSSYVSALRMGTANGAVTVTARVGSALDTTVTVTVTARQEGRTVTRQAGLPPRGLQVAVLFEAGALSPGEWIFTAAAQPTGLVNTENATATITIAAPPLPPLPPALSLSAETAVLAGAEVRVALLAERAPAGDVTVEVTGRRGGDDAAEVRRVTLDSSVSSATAVFGVLEPGEWTFLATAEPAGLLNTSSATVTMMVKLPPPLLTLSAPSSVLAGTGVEIALLAERAPAGDVTVEVTGRHRASNAIRTAQAMLGSSTFEEVAVFEAGALVSPGEWIFTAAAVPANLLNTENATATITIEDLLPPVLNLTAERSVVTTGEEVAIILWAEDAPQSNVLVVVRAQQGDANVAHSAALGPQSSSAVVVFTADELGLGEWVFRASAEPADLLDTTSATAVVSVLPPPLLSLAAGQATAPAGNALRITLQSERAPAGNAAVTVIARHRATGTTKTTTVTLGPSVSSATAVFARGALVPGEWFFTASAEPAGLLNTSNATATVTVLTSALSLTAAASVSGDLSLSALFRHLPWPLYGNHLPRVVSSPKDRLAFVAARERNLRVFRMGADGSDPVQLHSYPIGGISAWAHDMEISPDGKLLFVMGCLRDSAYSYSISVWRIGADGSLTQLSDYHAKRGMDIALSPNGKLLFAKDEALARLYIWQVNKKSGVLNAGKEYYQSGGGTEITVSPNGNLLFIAGGTAGWISVWRVNAEDVTLQKKADYHYGVAGELANSRVAVSPDGHMLFVASEYGYLSTLGINADSSLVLLSVRGGTQHNRRCRNYWTREDKYPPGVCTDGSLYSAEGIAVSPDGSQLYVAGKDIQERHLLSTWKVNRLHGTLSLGKEYRNAEMGRVENLVIDAANSLLFAIEESHLNGHISAWRINHSRGAVTVTAQAEKAAEVPVTVAVTARQGDRTVIRNAVLSLGSLLATTVFEAGVLTPGQWKFTASAKPKNVLDTTRATATLTVSAPSLTLETGLQRVPMGSSVPVRVVAEEAPWTEVTITVAARRADHAMVTKKVKLGPSTRTVTTLFGAGELGRGEWTFTASAKPKNALNVANARASVTVMAPDLHLRAEQASVAFGSTVAITVSASLLKENVQVSVLAYKLAGEYRYHTTHTATVTLRPSATMATAIFPAGALDSGEWRFTATAEPADAVHTQGAEALVSVAQPTAPMQAVLSAAPASVTTGEPFVLRLDLVRTVTPRFEEDYAAWLPSDFIVSESRNGQVVREIPMRHTRRGTFALASTSVSVVHSEPGRYTYTLREAAGQDLVKNEPEVQISVEVHALGPTPSTPSELPVLRLVPDRDTMTVQERLTILLRASEMPMADVWVTLLAQRGDSTSTREAGVLLSPEALASSPTVMFRRVLLSRVSSQTSVVFESIVFEPNWLRPGGWIFTATAEPTGLLDTVDAIAMVRVLPPAPTGVVEVDSAGTTQTSVINTPTVVDVTPSLPALRLVPARSQIENIDHLRLRVSLDAEPEAAVHVYVTAVQASGGREVNVNAMFSPGKRAVSIIYTATTLDPGEWHFSARAEPAGIIDLSQASTSVRVLEGPIMRASMSAAPVSVAVGEEFVVRVSMTRAAQGPATFYVQEHRGDDTPIVEYPQHFIRGENFRALRRTPVIPGEYTYTLREIAGQNIVVNEAALWATVQVREAELESGPTVFGPPMEITPPPMPEEEGALISVALFAPLAVTLGSEVQVLAALAMAPQTDVTLFLVVGPDSDQEALTMLVGAGNTTAAVSFTPVSTGTWTIALLSSTPSAIVASGSTTAVIVTESESLSALVDETATDVSRDVLDHLEQCEEGTCPEEVSVAEESTTDADTRRVIREEVVGILQGLEQAIVNSAARLRILQRLLSR